MFMAHKEKDMFYVQQLHHCEPDHSSILKVHELTIIFLHMPLTWFSTVTLICALEERKQRDGWRLGEITVEHNLTFSFQSSINLLHVL